MCRKEEEEPTKKKLKSNGKYSSLNIGSLLLKFNSSHSFFYRPFQGGYTW
jgi:hypothetical protein